jgi:hypothetical protein
MPAFQLETLRSEVDREMNMMTAVATGGPRIQEVDDEYRERRKRVRALLRELGLEDPNPHVDLWAWYGKWSRDLPTYLERRVYVRDTFQPLLDAITELETDTVGTDLPGLDLNGWPAVTGQTAQLRIRLASCTTSEDAQAVGLLCRDIMISLAEAVHDPATCGDVGASAVDQLNSVVDYHAKGPSNASLRKLVKAAIDYANVIQHRRGGDVAAAGLVAEATIGVVHLTRRLIETSETG